MIVDLLVILDLINPIFKPPAFLSVIENKKPVTRASRFTKIEQGLGMLLKRKNWLTISLLLAIALLKTTLAVAANAPGVIKTEQLGGAERYLAYVTTDKPIYRVGETVYIRTVVLSAIDNIPNKITDTSTVVKIKGPKGDVVYEGMATGVDGAIGFQWNVPEDLAGGEYTAHVSNPLIGVPESTRTFDVRAFRVPRLKTQIEFMRDGYGAGDTVHASVSIERAEGGVPSDASVYAIARVDGEEIFRSAGLSITEDGIVATQFELPEEIVHGEGSLSFVIEDGGVVESAIRSLPLLLQKLDIEFFPESGDLIAGLESRVYFQVLLPNGKPADVKGRIVELQGDKPSAITVAKFSSKHEGRGMFTFTPTKGVSYAAVFDAPSGISVAQPLPLQKNKGAVLSSAKPAFEFNEPIEFTLLSNSVAKPARVTLHKREVLLDSQDIIGNVIRLNAKDAEGVLIATVWNANGQPMAERLVFRHPRFGLNVELNVSDGPLNPGGEVSIDILTTDNNGNPVEAVVGITVSDDNVLELIEKREQAPRLPVMVYLENDVLDLADAHVYLDKENAQAENSIDLLLGTQGWRRFVLVNYADIGNRYPLKAKHVLAENKRQHANILRRLLQRDERAEIGILAAAPAANADMRMLKGDVNKAENLQQADPQDLQALQLQNVEAKQLVVAELEAPVVEEVMEDDVQGMLFLGQDRRARADFVGYVREFSFKARANRKPNERIDFTETLYWNTGIKTGARDGRASISFSLSDSVTTFRVMADGYGRNGALGSGDALVASVEPFYTTIKMPLHAVVGDVIELPVSMVNTTDQAMSSAHIVVTGSGISAKKTKTITLAPGQRYRNVLRVVVEQAGTFPISVVAEAGNYSDTLTRSLQVSPAGFPVSVNSGGLLSPEKSFVTTIAIPNEFAKGSLVASAKVYPTPLANMEAALNALLREPHGCFEQTSSTNYPLVMAQQYFQSHSGINPELISRTQGLLKTGYEKLTGFESADNGYEWFGANPAHEALTAYGLMEFVDMAKVMDVDEKMIERTRAWLLSRRDGKGGFRRNERALDSFGRAPLATTNAYIVWALLESGQQPESLQAEINQIKDEAFKGKDSYVIALAANILHLAGDKISANVLMKKLSDAVDEKGFVTGANTSITRSGGITLDIETTSLATLAWLRNDEVWAGQVEESIKWLFESVKAGRFGTTQSTVLVLKVINAYDAARAKPKAPGAIQLFVDGRAFGHAVAFDSSTKGVIELPDFKSALRSGENQIELRMNNGSAMPFSLNVEFNTALPVSHDVISVGIETSLSHDTVTEGEPVELKALISTGQVAVSSPIAIIGIPAGLDVQHDQLKELVARDVVSAYEVRDSEVILYWRAFKANTQRAVTLSLIASIPGEYTAPASRVYPYYTDEQKDWMAGHQVAVIAR